MRLTHTLRHALLVPGIAMLAIASTTAEAQQPESRVEERARLERRGASLRVGHWQVRGLVEVDGSDDSRTPVLEGSFAHGLDRHLALESSVGVWRRRQETRQGGGIGGESIERVDSWVVPMFSALTFYPFTGPRSRIEPYVEGGVGLAVGIEDRETTTGGLFGGENSGIGMGAGFGFKGGAGIDLRFTPALALSLGSRYQWVRFFEDLGGERIYRGFAADVGLRYRFQYD